MEQSLVFPGRSWGGNFVYLLLCCHDSFHLPSDIREMANTKEMTAIYYQEACFESHGSQLRLLYNCIRILIVPYTKLVSCSSSTAKLESKSTTPCYQPLILRIPLQVVG